MPSTPEQYQRARARKQFKDDPAAVKVPPEAQAAIDAAYELMAEDRAIVAPLPAEQAEGDAPGLPITQAQRERLRAMSMSAEPGSAPWEQQPGEPKTAYAAFQIYRTTDPNARSITATAKETGGSYKTMTKWSSRFAWVARTRQYDAWLVTQKDEAARRAIAEEALQIRQQQNTVLQQQLAAGRALMRECLRGIQTEKAKANPDARNLSLIGQALTQAVNAQRLATGMPTELTRQDVNLRKVAEESTRLQAIVMQIIQEIMCDECRQRFGDELERVQASRRNIADTLGIL